MAMFAVRRFPHISAPLNQKNKTMITIDGKYTEARVFTDELEDLARTQIRDVCNHPAFEGSRVRIMPDVHAGAGCVIGFTAPRWPDWFQTPDLRWRGYRLRSAYRQTVRTAGFFQL